MPKHLFAIHDPGGEHLILGSQRSGWIVHTVSVKDEAPRDYRMWEQYGLTNIARLNWGYGSTGTIPKPDQYRYFADLCAQYVSRSPGCTKWIIGNEPNHSQEWPDGQQITVERYVEAYRLCREAIKAVQPYAEIIPAAIAPWNVEAGDWLDYFEQMLMLIGLGNLEGIALHTYTHGLDPALVTSEQRMDAPFTDRRFHFRAYQDFLKRVPVNMRRLPVYITEFDGDMAWEDRNTGLIQAAYAEIDRWNKMGATQKIMCLAVYRWLNYDRWGFEGKEGVHRDFVAATLHNYESPLSFARTNGASKGNTLHMPIITENHKPDKGNNPQTGHDAEQPVEWDVRLNYRGVSIQPADVAEGQTYWRVVKGQWFSEQEADRIGPDHHILVDALDEQGKRVPGVSFIVRWPDGAERITTQEKPGELWAADYPMSRSLNEFSITVADGMGSERVVGLGMGDVDSPELGTQRNPGVHTSTLLVFQRTVKRTAQKPQEKPAKKPQKYIGLVHPVETPDYRIVTQPFGVNREYYSQFSYDGVPLLGHHGVDFATPVGSNIVAADTGKVVEAQDDPQGWGLYVKLKHSWGETLYAHLSRVWVNVGQEVIYGESIGLSGNSGNSTGPHLHFGIRVNPYRRDDGWGGFSDPMYYLQESGVVPSPDSQNEMVVRTVVEAALEFGVNPHLLLSLVWGESSFRVNAESDYGAKGLGQITNLVWDDWAHQIGATNIYDPRDNVRVAAVYLAWLIRTLDGDELKAVAAYNFGIGHVLQGRSWPLETLIFAHKVIHGKDLLEVSGKWLSPYLDN